MTRYCVIIGVTIGFIILDVVTGYLSALLKKAVSSSVMRKGLIKKAAECVVIAVSVLMHVGMPYAGITLPFSTISVFCAFLMVMEVTSIFENANKITGGKLDGLIKKIKFLKSEDDEEKK